MRGHCTAARLIQSQRRKSSLKEREDVTSVFLTEEAEQLEPAEVLLAAVLLLAVCRQVPQMMKLKQVDDSDVDQLLSAEGFLQDQPLHTAQFTRSSTDAPSPRPSLSLPAPLSLSPRPSPHTLPLSPHPTLSPPPLPTPLHLLSTPSPSPRPTWNCSSSFSL